MLVDDPEISRTGVALERHGVRMPVRDLGRRREQEVETAALEDHSELRMGGTALMVLVADAD